MTLSCPPADEWSQLLDGELTEGRAAALRSHLTSCSRCKAEWRRSQRLLTRIAAPLAGSRPADVEGVMRRLGAPSSRLARPPRSRWRVAVAAASVLAASLCALALLPGREERGFQARGEVTQAEWFRRVGVNFYAMGPSPRLLGSFSPVWPRTPLLGIYRNIDTTGPVYLLAFVLDSRETVHWLYPGYTEVGQDPASVLLAQRREDTPLPETVVLEAPAEGPARLVVVLSHAPLHVSDIESLDARRLSPSALSARLGASVHVREWTLRFTR